MWNVFVVLDRVTTNAVGESPMECVAGLSSREVTSLLRTVYGLMRAAFRRIEQEAWMFPTPCRL